jgi:hypothetical protein
VSPTFIAPGAEPDSSALQPPQPNAGPDAPAAIEQIDARSLERGLNQGRTATVQLVTAALEAAYRAAAHPGTLGQVRLRPIEKPTGGAALLWRQRHANDMIISMEKVNIV